MSHLFIKNIRNLTTAGIYASNTARARHIARRLFQVLFISNNER